MKIELEWLSISKFKSPSFTQHFLTACYEKKQMANAHQFAYQNCYPFIYYLEYGQKYFNQVNHAPMELHPILLFYGTIQLMKACILTEDPAYPDNSQVLAHGVSTRKRKKTQYIFLEDEVKVQKNGLLSHFSDKMFHVKHFPGEKYKMRQLLRQIVELDPLFSVIEKKKNKYLLKQKTAHTWTIDKKILDDYKIGITGFTSFLSHRFQIASISENENELLIEIPKPLIPYHCTPFYYGLNHQYYIAAEREELLQIPEIVIHYLLLYNLSMICRYETEWWQDLFHHNSEKDFPFIETFLSIAKQKVPLFLFSFLNAKIKG